MAKKDKDDNRFFKFSVVIPAYNEEQHVGDCLNALLNQTYPVYEIIVVNNNSTDKTAEIVQGFKEVKLVHEAKQGIAYARNAGFNQASGDFIARIDADSIVPADWLEKMVSLYESNPEIIGIGGPAIFYDVPLGRFIGRCHAFYAGYGTRMINGNNLLWGSNMSFKRKVWFKIRDSVNNDSAVWEDVDLSVRAGRYGPIAFLFNNPVFTSARSCDGGFKKQYDYYKHWPKTYKQFGLKPYAISQLMFISIVVLTIVPGVAGLRMFKHPMVKKFRTLLTQARA